MMFWTGRKKRGQPDAEALFDALHHAAQNVDEDTYTDFRILFLGSERGKRVLHQILAWGHTYHSSVVPGDPYATHVREGERNLAIRILVALNFEPPVNPGEQDGDE